jgi:hypothetical protein
MRLAAMAGRAPVQNEATMPEPRSISTLSVPDEQAYFGGSERTNRGDLGVDPGRRSLHEAGNLNSQWVLF